MKKTKILHAEESPYTFTKVKTVILYSLYDLSEIEPDKIDRECSLLKDFGLSDLDRTAFLMWCEKTFELTITYEEELNISTVGDLLDTIKCKKKWRKE